MRHLRAELDRPAPLPSWEERPIPNDWASADPVAAGQIESAGGMVAERFAFCAAMPLEQVVAVAEALRPARYRPIRLRPYRGGSDGRLLASLAWTRDARPWRIDLGLTAASLAEAAKVAVSAGLEPVHLAGYRPGPKDASPAEIRYACVRQGFEPGQPPASTQVFESDDAFRRWVEALEARPAGFYVTLQTTHQILDLPDGSRAHAVVSAQFTWTGVGQVEIRRFDGIAADFRGDRHPADS